MKSSTCLILFGIREKLWCRFQGSAAQSAPPALGSADDLRRYGSQTQHVPYLIFRIIVLCHNRATQMHSSSLST